MFQGAYTKDNPEMEFVFMPPAVQFSIRRFHDADMTVLNERQNHRKCEDGENKYSVIMPPVSRVMEVYSWKKLPCEQELLLRRKHFALINSSDRNYYL